MHPNPAYSVLVADRDERFRDELSESLEAAGIKIYQASDGNVAIAMALVKKPDAIVLASNLPSRSGIMVLEYLAQATSTIFPVVMTSNTDSLRYSRYAKLVGATDFVVKPESSHYIADRVRALLPAKPAISRRSA
jgi:two-component system response regulator VicR